MLAQTLSQFLPRDAASWLVMLYDAIQVFDDAWDGDDVAKPALSACIWNTLVAMPQNKFFAANSDALLPAVGTMVMKWHAANAAEVSKTHDAKSFVWRAGYYDIVLLVVILCRGPEFAQENAKTILSLYGETLTGYMGEFNA